MCEVPTSKWNGQSNEDFAVLCAPTVGTPKLKVANLKVDLIHFCEDLIVLTQLEQFKYPILWWTSFKNIKTPMCFYTLDNKSIQSHGGVNSCA